MKNIFISTTYSPGNSVYEYYKALGTEFSTLGFHVVYIFDQQEKKLPEKSESFTYYVWPSKRPTKIRDFLFLRKLLKNYHPKYTIATFGSVNVMLLASYIYKVKNRIAWIRTTQSQILIDSENQIKSKLLTYRKALIYKLSSKLYTNSEKTRQDCITTFNIDKKKIAVLHNLKKKTTIKTKPKSERGFSIVIVGRLDKSKGHSILLKQFKNVLINYPNLKLKIVGSGILLKKLKKLTRKLNITENIIFLGEIKHELVSEIFSKSLIGISSSFSESFGWVNIEALNEGTPIICSKTEGSESILKPGINGEFFYHNKPTSLISALEKIISNWDTYSNGALETFNKNFNLDKLINNHTNEILNYSKKE